MRPPKPLKILIPLAALLALGVAGCGGGGSGDSTATTAKVETTAALSKAELISQGDAICAEVNAAVGSVGSAENEAAQEATQVAGLYISMVEDVKGLGMPSEASGYAELLAAGDELAAVEGEAKAAAEEEDTVALEEASTKAGPILEEFQSAAAGFGFKDCSEGPSVPTVTGAGTGSGEESGEAEAGGVEVAPEVEEEVAPEEAAPEEEIAPETGGAGGTPEAAPEETGGSSGSSGGVGPG
jgi:hypothetical protein